MQMKVLSKKLRYVQYAKQESDEFFNDGKFDPKAWIPDGRILEEEYKNELLPKKIRGFIPTEVKIYN